MPVELLLPAAALLRESLSLWCCGLVRHDLKRIASFLVLPTIYRNTFAPQAVNRNKGARGDHQPADKTKDNIREKNQWNEDGKPDSKCGLFHVVPSVLLNEFVVYRGLSLLGASLPRQPAPAIISEDVQQSRR